MTTISPIARAPDDDTFDATLRLWGRVHGVRLHDDEPAKATHAIAVAMEHGAKSRTQYAMDAAKRRSKERRRFMARGLRSCGVSIVPESYVDPVPCKDDSGKHRGLGDDPMQTPQVRTLQEAWEALHRTFPDQAEIVAMVYQRPDLLTNAARADALGITLRTFEDKLRLGKQWMRAGASLLRAVAQAAETWERGA